MRRSKIRLDMPRPGSRQPAQSFSGTVEALPKYDARVFMHVPSNEGFQIFAI